MTTVIQKPSIQINQFAKLTARAVLISVTLNIALYTIGTLGGWLPAVATSGDVTLAPVLIFSVVPPILGAIFFYVLARVMNRPKATQLFIGLSSLVLIGMSIGPVTNIIDPKVGTVLLLELMHLVVAFPIMYLLTKKLDEPR